MIFFLYGADTFRCSQKLFELREKFQKDVDPGGDSIKILDGEKLSLQEFSAASASSSLFVKRRLIIVKNIFSNKNKEIFLELSNFLKIIEKQVGAYELNQNDNIIIFTDDNSGDKLAKNVLRQFLLKQKFVQEFLPLTHDSLTEWIINLATRLEAVLPREEALKISGSFGNDLWKIENELKKLVNYKKALSGKQLEGGKVIIERNDLNILSPGKINENIFAFTDAIGNKEKSKAIELLENEIEAGVAEMQLLNMIIRQIKTLLQLRQAIDLGYSQKKISTEIKMHPYVMQKSLRQARNFPLELLKTIFNKLTILDRDIKSGKADFKLSIDLLIAGL